MAPPPTHPSWHTLTCGREYLGDGVYVEVNNYGQLVLTAGSNTIYLESREWQALLAYVAKVDDAAKTLAADPP